MTKQKWKEYQGIRATEKFDYENARSDFKQLLLELRKVNSYVRKGIPGTQGAFSEKVLSDNDGYILLINQ